ncbi:6-carboxyhexanoate--CoA ligase [Sporohalobacter salinus]|uniref:6-carboxyhexanoate--CoA ligase n=1 Tax=Sporohalobacter salinus TaxID=1494606 RepID=UPI00195F948D|nr:6-carboxyhexanoate--CoA ligase [Sporohalobacter salinus]MBM7622561.1 6-carboxyhexanoate--CoA ligase [Sporohalobacter salinus]
MSDEFFSLRMRAAQGGKHQQGGRHISGAERIITEDKLEANINSLINRAREHSQGSADYINLTLEVLERANIEKISSLPITTITVDSYQVGRREAKELLMKLEIKEQVIKQAQHLLATGANPAGDNMRGAIVMDLDTGERLEPDYYRGLRASKMDYTREVKDRLINLLSQNNLNQSHLPEALALATKVVSYLDIVAELCWSDDSNYTAGYVASKKFGYCRFPALKPSGLDKGGRVFFVRLSTCLEKLVTYLEEKPVLISRLDERITSYNSVARFLEARGDN